MVEKGHLEAIRLDQKYQTRLFESIQTQYFSTFPPGDNLAGKHYLEDLRLNQKHNNCQFDHSEQVSFYLHTFSLY